MINIVLALHCYPQQAGMEGATPPRIPMPAQLPRPIDQLEQTIQARKAASGEKSYTAKLLAGGVDKIGSKITEEAAEVVEAAGEQGEEGRQHTIREAGDLLYHLLVLMAARDVSFEEEVENELARRFGVSGLEEKASRKKGS